MELKERQDRAKLILLDLYRLGYVETIYNTEKERHQKEGWTLKNGSWSPWYFNLRPVGASPHVVSDIAYVMNHMIRDEVPGITQLVGVEMAGVPLVAAIGTATGCESIPYAYTRPLKTKVRTVEEAKRAIADLKGSRPTYGGKELVEGRFKDGDIACITDDMVTNFASKVIARMILECDLEGRAVGNVDISHAAVVLDREQGAAAEAKKYGMSLHALIKFKTDGLGWLREVMRPEEYQLITDFQENPDKYQIYPNKPGNDGERERKMALEKANRIMGR
jgi:orotate phosphoribosyltransferase